MNSRDLISMGVRNLWRRKARSILTILGVIIGTAAIIVMLSLGIGMQRSFESSLDGMGSINVINVYPRWEGDMDKGGISKIGKLNDKVLQEFRSIQNVTAVMPYLNAYSEIKSGRYMANVSIIGIDMKEATNFDFKIEKGRFPDPTAKNELLVGSNIKEEFRDSTKRGRRRYDGGVDIDLMNSSLRMVFDEEMTSEKKVRGRKVEVVGELTMSDNEHDWNVYMDIAQLENIKKDIAKKNKSNANKRDRQKNQNKYEHIDVKVSDIKAVKDVQDQIKEMGFEAWSLSDVLQEMKKVSSGIQAVLGGIGAVSLFVAALGITNTMIMSIYERTKEIGVMKVLGANLKDIKRLFLFEAGLIGIIGGMVGIVISYGISHLINKVGVDFLSMGVVGDISVIPLWLVGVALIFSTFIGVASGYYPALRAMKLSALEAIRNDG